MSMSQEEIESLMNGLDFEESTAVEESEVEDTESQVSMSEDDINDLIAQTEDIASNEATEESVDDILKNLENIEVDEPETEEETNIDDILKELEKEAPVPDSATEEETPDVGPELFEELSTPEVSEVETPTDDIDELLSTIDDIQEPIVEEVSVPEETPVIENDIESLTPEVVEVDVPTDDIDHKINSGVFPLPVDEDTKVVNQLSEVATDSEEKATKIFDVLSNILDYNNAIQNDIQALTTFNESQVAMLSSLSEKFPNIDAFNQNLEHAQKMSAHISDANEKLNDGNTEIFQAMELMQYHDINRQKIERVMSVIRKLSSYLNNLFEDEGNREEVVVANHIHGDKGTDNLVDDDDLESLIAEFNN